MVWPVKTSHKSNHISIKARQKYNFLYNLSLTLLKNNSVLGL